MSNDIALYKLSDMQVMAEAIARSGLFGMKSPDQALALMLVAQSENQHPATITQDYDIIQGKACRKTHSVMARFQQRGGKIEWHKLTDSSADATFSHPSGGSLRIEWTIDQAKKAGLSNKDNWKNYPRAMLRARVIAEGVRAVYPAAIGGMLVAEEASDMPAVERDMGTIDSETGEVTPPAKPALPPCPDTKIDRWFANVTEGKAKADELLAFAKGRYSLSDVQEGRILAFVAVSKATADNTDDFVKQMEDAEREPGQD